MKYFGLTLRVIRYLTIGIVSLDKLLLKKAWYSIFSMMRMLTSRWKYINGVKGRAEQWEI